MNLKLQIDRKFKGLCVHTVERNILWASHGYTLCRSLDYGETWEKIVRVPANPLRLGASYSNLLSRLLRTGIHNIVLLPSGNLLLIADGKIYRLNTKKGHLREVHRLRVGRRPLRNGCCIDARNNIYYGEYWANQESHMQ